MAETKKCWNCEQEIGTSEKICPKCQVNLDMLEEEMTVVDRANKALERKRKAEDPPLPPPTPPVPAKKKSIFRSLTGGE